MAGQTGKAHKIPEKYWQEMYDLYASGVTSSAIHKKCREEWQIDVSERTVGSTIKILRDEKRKQINELLNAEADDDVGRLNWLQNQLEEIAIECRVNDKPLFLKAADRLIRIHQLKLAVRSSNLPNHFNENISNDEEARLKLIDELQKIN